jgi:hypothetical protein
MKKIGIIAKVLRIVADNRGRTTTRLVSFVSMASSSMAAA